MSRMLGAAPVLADAIVEQLCAASDAAAQSHRPLGAESEADAERLSAAIWHSIWPVERCVCKLCAFQSVTYALHPWWKCGCLQALHLARREVICLHFTLGLMPCMHG